LAGRSSGGEPPRRETVLDCGLRVVSESLVGMRSVALGLFIAAGSLYERPEEAGISHLIEHLLFRGTASYSSFELDRLFDELGATANAETDKEFTALSCRALDSHLERALPAMVEMVFAPTLEGLEAERAVILQELASYEDDPQDQVFERFAEVVFPDHPLGRPVIGTRPSIEAIDEPALRAYRSGCYLPGRVVLAAAGSVDHDELCRLVEGCVARLDLAPTDHARDQPDPPPPHRSRLYFQRKETEQYHLCLGGRGLVRDDPRRFALRVMEVILGSTPSSRLFQEVRERRGLAYSVFTFSTLYGRSGELGIYLGTGATELGEALEVVVEQLQLLAGEPPGAEELARAKECAKSATALALESSAARMARLGTSTLLGSELLALDRIIDELERVEAEQVQRLAADLLEPRGLSLAVIGPDPEPLERALEPLRAVGAPLAEDLAAQA